MERLQGEKSSRDSTPHPLHFAHPMPLSLVITVIGPDRPGLVERLSSVIAESGGNWEGSRMARLGGQFAGVVQIALPEERLDALESALASLAGTGISAQVVHRGGEDLPRGEHEDRVALVEVVGQDRPGIVSAISKALADAGANVVEFASDCVAAPWSGERLFKTRAVLHLPEGGHPEELRERLEAIASDLMVECRKKVEVGIET